MSAVNVMDEKLLFKNRMNEFAVRSDAKCIYTFSEFLTQAQQSELAFLRPIVPYELYGGYPDAERCKSIGDALGLPSTVKPLCVIPIGHPAGENQPKDKWKPENIHYGRW